MGRGTVEHTFSHGERQRYRTKIQRCLDALARMLAAGSFSTEAERIGLEIELNLVDEVLDPAMANTRVLAEIADPTFKAELSQHNLEINVRPRPLAGDEAIALEAELRLAMDAADASARRVGAAVVMIGILPTVRRQNFELRWMSPNQRYVELNEQLMSARREQMELDMEGVPLDGAVPDRLLTHTDTILPESACTSVQLHLQVAPADFAAHWNAAQCLAGVQVALAANSPFLLGQALWHETRIPLFEQSCDTRPPELRNQGVRPRVWFGERWITSIFDLFEENVRYFTPLLPETQDEDPLAVLDNGGAPSLSELRLHNGTVWRWNRPIYDIVDGVAHLRIENRVLPAGPTVVDVLANAAFFYGAMRALTEQQRPMWTQMSFAAAEENFYAGARNAMDAELYWPGMGRVTPDELVLRKLLSLAHDGLRSLGVSDAAREHYLGVIEQRCVARQTGSSWQRETVAALRGDRRAALTGMLRRYVEHMHTNQPVHTWPV